MARLQAVPHATECIDCARAGERRRAEGDNSDLPRELNSFAPEEAA